MFREWTGRWEQLLLEQKPRMYIVQDDGGLTEAAIDSKNLNSKTVCLIVDINARAIWIWHGKDVGPKDRFIGARAARSLRSVIGPTFRTMSPIGEGEETPDFLKAIQLEDVSEEPPTPAIQLEDVPEEPPISVIQLEDVPEDPPISVIQLEDAISSTEEIDEAVTNSELMVNVDESKIEKPSEVSLPSMASETLRDLVSLIIAYTLKQIYRTEPLTSRIKMFDIFRIGKDNVQQCRIKIELQNTTINVVEAFFDEKDEESAFYDALNEHLKMLRKIDLSR